MTTCKANSNSNFNLNKGITMTTCKANANSNFNLNSNLNKGITMTESEKSQCHAIIHTHAAACAMGNLAPLPGVGLAADIVAMTTMCLALSAVFGGSLTENAAKGLAVAALKRTVLKHPIKVIGKELSKLIPGLGQIFAPAVSVALMEATGWTLAKELKQMAAASGSRQECP
ncbi:MAG: hypothetical protein IJS08_01425 [Victivallales bacterium]|nr:hypothetical protein [Victivallales bacterium]